MNYPVEQINYVNVVESMAKAGLDGMADVIAEQFGKLGKPVWANEITFFWRSLYNAARANDMVWLWLVTQPHIRNFAPEGAAQYTMPGLAPEAKLPLIGGIDDAPYQPSEPRKEWPEEPTVKNFVAQATALDEYLKDSAKGHSEKRSKCVDDYVASFYYSGTGKIFARTQLMESGFHALATEEGLRYLMETYPPAEERTKPWFVRKSIMALVTREFPEASVSAQHIEAKAPQNEEEFNANVRLWVMVFERLYPAATTLKRLPILAFWHRLPEEPAPIKNYTKWEQFWKQHPRAAKLCRVAVPEKTVEGETVEVEVHDAGLLFGNPEKLTEGVVTFCVTAEERARILKPGLQGVSIMLPIQHPHKFFIPAGSIHRIMLP